MDLSSSITSIFITLSNNVSKTNTFSARMEFFCTFAKNSLAPMMLIPDIVIAIDGFSSTGKSSFAKLIAKEFGFLYLDSGALYRGVTLYAMENGLIDGENRIDGERLCRGLADLDLHFRQEADGCRTYMGDRCIEKEIRSLAVSRKVSPIAAFAPVREYVDRKLRELGIRKRVVIDGRDIGSTVFPDAELKIFMTADPQTRAMRRMKELEGKGEKVSFSDVLENVRERDYIDSHRQVSPLAKADDAIVLDNSEMTIEEQMVWIRELIAERFGNKSVQQ